MSVLINMLYRTLLKPQHVRCVYPEVVKRILNGDNKGIDQKEVSLGA